MNAKQFTIGFRVAGAPHEPRRIVTWRKAWAAHCSGELDTTEAFLSAWTYGPELLAHVKATGGVAGYGGPIGAEWIPVDIDGGDIDPVVDALDRTRRMLAWLESKTAADLNALSCWFSGRKGFHVYLPTVSIGTEPGPNFNMTARAFVAHIGLESGAGPDMKIYDPVRILRAPGTQHPKTGLFKIPLRGDELMRISADTVRNMSAKPCPGDVPEPGPWCDWNAADWWRKAANDARAQFSMRKEAAIKPRTDLNRATLDFIRNGAPPGERATRLFSASANLAELGAGERLAHALLGPVARDSGLSPAEISKQIHDGLAHGGRRIAS